MTGSDDETAETEIYPVLTSFFFLFFFDCDSDVHVIGIRSKTKLSARVLAEAKNLVSIGCFCIGTNQVDLQYAAAHGIAVFNSPFSNSRSVAELIIGEIIALARQLGDRSMEMHQGTWNKVSNKCWEVRGKTLGRRTFFFLSFITAPPTMRFYLIFLRNHRLRPHWFAALCPRRGHEHVCHLL